MSKIPGYRLKKVKTVPKEFRSCSAYCPLIAYIGLFEILVTALLTEPFFHLLDFGTLEKDSAWIE